MQVSENRAIQRRQLSEFLKACRARTTPQDIGLPRRARTRTPGLRREDVAVLSGVSVSWYTWLEQGRDIQVSGKVLDRLSGTFRLSDSERDYLYLLAHGRKPQPTQGREVHVSDALKRLIARTPFPAVITNERWDILAWNDLHALAFHDWASMPADERNLMRAVCHDHLPAANNGGADASLRNAVAKFRYDCSQAADVAGFQALVDDLSAGNAQFREYWSRADLEHQSELLLTVKHPDVGDCEYEFSSYIPEAQPLLKVWYAVPRA